jgi:prepilin-type N-terminal cleavage/methylation domain-containing protein
MDSSYRRGKGFTLIELMVTVAIIIILAACAFPSFEAQRQRAAMRGAADQMLNFWNQARMEALKRNAMVKVGFRQSNSGATFCMGPRSRPTPETPPPATAPAPPLQRHLRRGAVPGDNAEWRSVSLSGITLGGGSTISDMEPVVIDPKRLFLAVPADDGTVTLSGPPGPRSYKINLSVDRFGRGYLCQSSSAADNMTDYTNTNRVCSP